MTAIQFNILILTTVLILESVFSANLKYPLKVLPGLENQFNYNQPTFSSKEQFRSTQEHSTLADKEDVSKTFAKPDLMLRVPPRTRTYVPTEINAAKPLTIGRNPSAVRRTSYEIPPRPPRRWSTEPSTRRASPIPLQNMKEPLNFLQDVPSESEDKIPTKESTPQLVFHQLDGRKIVDILYTLPNEKNETEVLGHEEKEVPAEKDLETVKTNLNGDENVEKEIKAVSIPENPKTFLSVYKPARENSAKEKENVFIVYAQSVKEVTEKPVEEMKKRSEAEEEKSEVLQKHSTEVITQENNEKSYEGNKKGEELEKKEEAETSVAEDLTEKKPEEEKVLIEKVKEEEVLIEKVKEEEKEKETSKDLEVQETINYSHPAQLVYYSNKIQENSPKVAQEKNKKTSSILSIRNSQKNQQNPKFKQPPYNYQFQSYPQPSGFLGNTFLQPKVPQPQRNPQYSAFSPSNLPKPVYSYLGSLKPQEPNTQNQNIFDDSPKTYYQNENMKRQQDSFSAFSPSNLPKPVYTYLGSLKPQEPNTQNQNIFDDLPKTYYQYENEKKDQKSFFGGFAPLIGY